MTTNINKEGKNYTIFNYYLLNIQSASKKY